MSVIFILRGTGIVLVLFCIYPIIPYASELFAQFLLHIKIFSIYFPSNIALKCISISRFSRDQKYLGLATLFK